MPLGGVLIVRDIGLWNDVMSWCYSALTESVIGGETHCTGLWAYGRLYCWNYPDHSS